MEPLLSPGHVVLVTPCRVEDLLPGDLVLYQSPGPCVHRLVRMQTRPGGPVFFSRGDARRQADPAWGASQLIGRVVGLEHGRHPPVPFGGRHRTINFWAAGLAHLEHSISRFARKSPVLISACLSRFPRGGQMANGLNLIFTTLFPAILVLLQKVFRQLIRTQAGLLRNSRSQSSHAQVCPCDSSKGCDTLTT